MTQVIVTSPQSNQLVIQEQGKVATVKIVENVVTTVIAPGPQGPPGEQGTAGSGIAVNDDAKVDKSIVYYDANSQSFKADALWTLLTVSDGGNF